MLKTERTIAMYHQYILGYYNCPNCKSIGLDTIVHVPKVPEKGREVGRVITIVCNDCHWNTAAL